MAGTGGPGRVTAPGLAADPMVAELLALCRFPVEVDSVDCAVSGGADSSALLVLAVAAGYRVHAYHVDHGIRLGSHAEARIVAELADRFGARFTALSRDVPEGADLEARARRARHDALPAGVLFGHTMEDQAETVLLRIMRGTGPGGLSAMSTDQHPILALRRGDTEALCAHLGISTVDDPSNRDPRFTRNRVRHELLPLMAEIANRDVVPLIARLASQSAGQAALIAGLAASIDPRDARAVSAAPGPLAAWALGNWWMESTRSAYPPDSAAIDRMMAVARGRSTSCDVVGGWVLRRTQQRLRLERRGVGDDREPARD